jgi:hypothetical protein
VRILSIEHGVIDCPETAHRLEAVSAGVTAFLRGGRAKLYKNESRDTTRYAVVANPVEEDGIIDELKDLVRAKAPSWSVTVHDGAGRPISRTGRGRLSES